jgi:lysophospholipase L1-like esterase
VDKVRRILLYVIFIFVISFSTAAIAADTCFDKELTTTPTLPFLPIHLLLERQVERLRDKSADVLIIGDSIARRMPESVVARFGKAINAGLPGALIQNILWEVDSLKNANLHPKTIVIVAGTNNLSFRYTNCSIAAGLEELVNEARRVWNPKTVILFDIPPRGQGGSFRQDDISQISSDIHVSGPGFYHIKLSAGIICIAGSQCNTYLPDMIHFTNEGYQFFTQALESVPLQ